MLTSEEYRKIYCETCKRKPCDHGDIFQKVVAFCIDLQGEDMREWSIVPDCLYFDRISLDGVGTREDAWDGIPLENLIELAKYE